MQRPLISLITVVYNGETLIADTLRSAINQTYKEIELVIVDGGSKDNTVAVARQFFDYIGTLISEKDNGIYDAMNKGIKAAKGEWVYFLNAGDSFYDANVLMDIFSKDLSAFDLIYGKVQTVNEPTGIDYITGEPVSFSDFFNRYPICHQATFTRKSCFETIGYYHPEYKLAADTEWFARFFKAQPDRALFSDRIIAFYDIQGATYHKRMQGYREYLHFGRKHFPFSISLKNHLFYPLMWLKVKLIRGLQHTAFFKSYRRLKFDKKLAN